MKKLIAQQPIPLINWADLNLQQLLGEGASGLIYQAQWQLNQAENVAKSSDVAVKMFKADLTSDGLPRCEIHATALAGQHRNLLGLIGVTHQHPNNEAGRVIPLLVMPLMDADLTVLANPPSFESCSRDVYADGTEFTIKTVLDIAHSIASAVAHLHAKGMTHGDLYAHNILSNQLSATKNISTKVLLSDLGGASFLPPDLKQSQQLQRVESHAFSCLLEELLNRCNGVERDSNDDIMQGLWQLQAQCAQAINAERPLFKVIEAKLAEINLANKFA